MENTVDVQSHAASDFNITRRNGYKGLSVLVQQRLEPDATSYHPVVGNDEWVTVAAFAHIISADLYISGFRTEYPNAQVEFRYLLL